MDEQIEHGSGNVYADLGFPDAEAMLAKSQLAGRIGQIIDARGLTHQAAAEIVGMPEEGLSRLLVGHFQAISEAKMQEYLNRLAQDVETGR